MLAIENFEKYIIQPNNVSASCIQKHMLENGLHNNFVSIEDWIIFLQKEQRDSLQIWLNFLNNINYSDEIKYWILNGVLKSAHYENNHFRRRTCHTIHTFPELNKKCVEEAIENQHINVAFQKIYAQRIKDLLEQKNDNGVWEKFSGINTIESLLNELQGWFTKWCINSYSSAYLHLLAGDIYVFFTEVDNQFVYPRICVGVEKTGTVRCIGLEPYQMMEDSMQPILEDHLSYLGISDKNKTYRLKYGSPKKIGL